MRSKHAAAAVSVVFDDPNLVSAAGLVPVLRLAQRAGLDELSQSRLSVPTDKGSNAGAKVMALVAGMCAGADSIDDMNVLRHGGMGSLFHCTYAPSTLGSFLRAFRFGHVRQLDAVASRTLVSLSCAAPLLEARGGEPVMVDVDDTIIQVHGYQKQGRVRVLRGAGPERADRDRLDVVGAGDPGPAAAQGRRRLPAGRSPDPRRCPGSTAARRPRSRPTGSGTRRLRVLTGTRPSAPRFARARTCRSPCGWTRP